MKNRFWSLSVVLLSAAILGFGSSAIAAHTPPHHKVRRKHHYVKRHDKSTHHAAIHAEHWVGDHLALRHKKP